MPDKDEHEELEEVKVKRSGEVVVVSEVPMKPIYSGIDQHVVLSQEDIDARQ